MLGGVISDDRSACLEHKDKMKSKFLLNLAFLLFAPLAVHAVAPPLVDGSPTATPIPCNEIDLTWNNHDSSNTYADLYRSIGSSFNPGTAISVHPTFRGNNKFLLAGSVTYKDTLGLVAGQTYSYQLVVVKTSGGTTTTEPHDIPNIFLPTDKCLSTTKTTVVADPQAISGGQNGTITLTAHVAKDTGTATVTPSGIVDFLVYDVTLSSFYSTSATLDPNGNASVSIQANIVSGQTGQHRVDAKFEGTPSVYTSSTGTTNISVGLSPSTTTVTSSPNPSTYGDAVALTATISPSLATGTVTFIDSGGSLGSVTLSGGQAALNTATLAAGSHSISAVYQGDNAYAGSNASLTQVVTAKGLTVTGITANNKVYDGTTKATLNTAGATLVGVVNGDLVSLNTTGAVGTFASPNVGTGIAVAITGLAVSGTNGNYTLAQPSAAADITKATLVSGGAGPATITITPYTVTYDGAAHTATGTATGINGENLNSLLNLSGTTHTDAGTYASDAWTFAGNANYNAAAGTVSDLINKATLVPGGPGSATIAITPYTVTYDGAAHTATGTATGINGENLSSLLNLSGTTHTNAATYSGDPWTFSGDANYSAASGTITDKINKASPTISTAPPIRAGDAISDKATLAVGVNPTGTITFQVFLNNTCGGTPIFTSTVPANGNGDYDSGSFHPTTAGTYVFQAIYSGDANNNPADSGCTGSSEQTLAFPPAQLINIATRLHVETRDDVLIGGFIVTGNAPKKVIIRAIGPSLTKAGLVDVLLDPILELHSPDGSVTINDNWRDTQQDAIIATTIPPTDDRESAIVATLPPGRYSAIVRGANESVGIGVVEVYDLDTAADSELANISSRGVVQARDNVMIGGVVVGGLSPAPATVIIRGIGPTLTQFGVPGALGDPTLTLFDGNGTVMKANDNWQDVPADAAAISATGVAPTNILEPAILVTLPVGRYTAIVAGKNNEAGVGLVEAYHLK